MPEISVILPAFNAETTIERAVRSILDQTFSDLELIVVDDGSSDGTRGILESIHDPRLLVISGKHRGVAHASNLAFQKSVGQYVARMDADDVSHPRRLEKQLLLLQENDWDAVGCQVEIVDAAGKKVESMQRYQRWINQDTLEPRQIMSLRFVELPLVNPSILAKRKYFELGFLNNEFPEDYELFLRAAEKGFRFGKVAESLLTWFESADRLTRNDERYSNQAFDGCRKKYLLSGPLALCEKVYLWGVGNTGKPWMRWLQDNGIEIERCFDVSQKKIGQAIHGTRVEPPENLIGPADCPLVVAVGSDGARDLIIKFVNERGMELGKDVWFVA